MSESEKRKIFCRCCQCWRHIEMVQGEFGLRPPDGWLQFFAKEAALMLRLCPDCAQSEPRKTPVESRHFQVGPSNIDIDPLTPSEVYLLAWLNSAGEFEKALHENAEVQRHLPTRIDGYGETPYVLLDDPGHVVRILEQKGLIMGSPWIFITQLGTDVLERFYPPKIST